MQLAAIGFMLLCAGKPLPANGKNAAVLSPDHRYLAITVFGEACCSYLFVCRVNPHLTNEAIAGLRKQAEKEALHGGGTETVPGTMFCRMDVDSFLWVPGKPHAVVYGESEIYGDGVVRLVDVGRRTTVLARPHAGEFQILLSSYDPARRRLTYAVTAEKGETSVTKTHRLTISLP